MSYEVGMSLRADMARAKAVGIDTRIRGWRKDLARSELTAAENEAARAYVAKANGNSRLRRIRKSVVRGCPYELHPEMEMVCYVYQGLRSAGLDAHLEVSAPSDLHKSGFMRIDIAVIRDGELWAAIECKREGKGVGKHTRQFHAYQRLRERFGTEIYLVNSRYEAEKIISELVAARERSQIPQHGS